MLTNTMAPPLYPLRFEPIVKRLIWGGRRLGDVLNKPIGEGSDYAECWEISDHRADVSRIADGPLAGQGLRQLIRERSEDLLGPVFADREQFPLLVKFIDARQDLSVQVHPDDEKGRRLANDNGKTETWVVMHAEPGSKIYAGLKEGISREEFAVAIARGNVEHLLHSFPAVPGDCILIPAGTVHAIGAGVMLAEIQQMSDATFRIYDWGRVGVDGKPRPLHIAESLESIDFDQGPVVPIRAQARPIPGGTVEQLARSDYFDLKRLNLDGSEMAEVGTPGRFTIVLVLEGAVDVQSDSDGWNTQPLEYAETMLIPASVGTCRIAPRGEAKVLTCVVP